jgi:hypothetical protein
MSEMSREQGQAHNDPNPTDDMVPPVARVPDSYVEKFGPRDSGAEDPGPQDFGAEDPGPQDFGAEDAGPQDFGAEDRNPPDDDSPQTPGLPLPGGNESGDIEDPGTTQGSSDPMPNMSGTSQPDS